MQGGPQKVFNSKRFISVCLSLLRHTSQVIRDVQSSGELGKIMKGADDPVTQADFKSQYIIETGLRAHWPSIKIVGEESAKNLLPVDFAQDPSDGDGHGLESLNDFDQNVDLDDIVVYIDPLDGTKAFTEGQLNQVTSLIGVSYKQEPYIGVISQIWDRHNTADGYQFDPTVYFGVVTHPRVYHVRFNNSNEKASLIDSYGKFAKHDMTKPWKLNVSVNHYLKSVEDLISYFHPSVERSGVSGMGARFIGMVRGEVDGFISNSSGAGRWDSLAGSALVQALGGKVCGVRGTNYAYNGDPTQVINTDGLFPLNDPDYHTEMLAKFIEYYKSIGESEGPLGKKK